MKVLVDTCVSLDLIQQRQDFFDDAKDLFEAIKEEKIEGYITVKSLMDVHYVTKHIVHDEAKARAIIQNLLILLKPLDSTASDALRALQSETIDYEDALMAETARTSGMDLIVTRNIRDYRNSDIKAVTPGETVKMIK